MSTSCPVCHSERVEDARLVSTGLQPERARPLAKLQAPAELTARVCFDCGHVGELRADTERLRDMVGEA